MVFQTNDDAEYFLSRLWEDDEGARYWRYVSIPMHVAWFYVVVEIKKPEPQISIILLPGTDDFLSFNEQHEAAIKSVYLVSPGYVNDSELWKMNPIESILQGTHSYMNSIEMEYVYVLTDGQRFMRNIHGTDESSLENVEVVYPLSNNTTG